MDNTTAIIQVKHIKKYYGKEPTNVKALDDVSLDIEKGSFSAIVGASGSGKSTLLHLIGGLDQPTSGTIFIAGKDLSKMNRHQATIYRRRNIGIVYQKYNLIQMLNVYENIVFPIEIDGNKPDYKYIDEILDTLGLKDKKNRKVNTLSGGQQQRVAIARALAIKPTILLCDEPTGNLDSRTSQDVIGLLKATSVKFHQTIIMITHNEEIAQMADRIIHIEDGKIINRKWGNPWL